MKFFPIAILLFLSFQLLSAQQEENTHLNLKQKIQESTNDSSRIDYQIKLIKQLVNSNLDTSRILANEVLNTIKEKPYNQFHFQKSKAIALNYKGIADSKESNEEIALSTYLEALDISERIQDTATIGLTLHNLGMFYRRKKEYSKAKEYLKKAIHLKETIGDPEELALSYHMLGITYYYNKELDSAKHYLQLTKQFPCSNIRKVKANGSLAAIYFSEKKYNKAISIYKEVIEVAKKIEDQAELSVNHLNLAVLYNAMKDYDNSLIQLDSAITIAKKLKRKDLLVTQYFSRSNLNETRGAYKEALIDYKTYKRYYDSINNIERAKRITTLELNYKFEKEKLANQLKLENESSKKYFYLILFSIAVISSLVIFWLIRKNAKQRLSIAQNKLEQEQLDKVKAELALVTRENEFKKVVVENSMRHEFLNKTLDEVNEIIQLENEQERKTALKSLTASLLSEKTNKKPTTDLHTYLSEVNLDFKIALDTNFSTLKPKEKELLSLMSLELSTSEISKLQNTTIAATKSSRYRIRKKLGIDSTESIIDFIKSRTDKNAL